MTVVELPRAFAATGVDGALMSWWDSDAEMHCRDCQTLRQGRVVADVTGRRRTYLSQARHRRGYRRRCDSPVRRHEAVLDEARFDGNSGRWHPCHRSADVTPTSHTPSPSGQANPASPWFAR